ncbi:MAG TPA: hypothetical protein VJB06_02610, partial [archaeon]|nr:hypothetical protein [archaeon]
RENLDLAKKQFKDKRDEFKRTKNVTDAKDYLLKVLDALVEKVNNLKERVGGSDDLSEEKAKEVLADLDARLTKLNDWKTKVQAAATKEELKKLVVEVRAGWKHIDHALKVHGWRVALEHFGGILRQAEHLDNKLNRLLDLADKNNVTINNKDSRVADFEAKLADSRKHFELAVGDFKKLRDLVGNKTENITDSEVAERKALVESSHNHLKVAKKSLKDARQVLVSLAKDTVKELKAKGAKTDDGKAVDIKEEDVLDPTKVIDGVDIEEGETAVPVAQEETIEL